MTWLRLKESDRDVIVNVSQIVALRYEGEITEIDGQ